MTPQTYTNYAFISYSHADMATAKWLQRRIEGYRLPAKTGGTGTPRYLRPIFRDQDDLTTGVLGELLKQQLMASKYLIVLCSPNSAKSAWVSEECRFFVESGRIGQIIPVMLPGKEAGNERELFPESLRKHFESKPEDELLGVNIAETGRDKALVRIVARMLGIDFDQLWRRHVRRRRRHIAATVTASLVGSLCAYTFAMPVSLDVDVKLQSAELPMPKTVSMRVAGADYEAGVKVPRFEGISLPGYYRFRDIQLTLDARFYEPVDTNVATGFGLERHVSVEMRRDTTFAVFAGTVYDGDMNSIEGAEVTVGGFRVTTDAQGRFTIALPLDRQRAELPVAIDAEGYAPLLRPDEVPGHDHKYIIRKQG